MIFNMLEKKYLVSEIVDLNLFFSFPAYLQNVTFPFITVTRFVGGHFHLRELGIIRVNHNKI